MLFEERAKKSRWSKFVTNVVKKSYEKRQKNVAEEGFLVDIGQICGKVKR